jgi:heme/copper-type cytochrome/quinol oxidase subunit 3
MTGSGVLTGPASGVPSSKLAVWWFLASETMTFGGLLGIFALSRYAAGGWHDASQHLHVWLAAANTLVLLTSSFTMVRAHAAAGHGERAATLRNLGATIGLGTLFLCIKAIEYCLELRAGFTPRSGAFWGFYYGLTGLHAAHVLGGVLVLTALAVTQMRQWQADVAERRVESAGLYWHFVDVVWIFLFPLVYLS